MSKKHPSNKSANAALRSSTQLKPALLCIVPPFSTLGPPAGVAYLLGYARQHDCFDFDFLDLRLGVPDAYAPTYVHTGIYGECYVMDVPDLPLVLSMLRAFDEGKEPATGFGQVVEDYCRARGVAVPYLEDYLRCMDRYLAAIAGQLTGARFVGCSVWTSNYLTTLLFAAHLKRLPHPPVIVLGGPQVTESRSSAALALRSHLADYVVTGEGEATLLDLYSHLGTAGGVRGPIAGTAALGGDDQVHYTPKRTLLLQDQIPIPVFDQMPLLAYQEVGQCSVPFHLSRGCTDKCTFCSEWVFWERFRPGDATAVLEGIRELQSAYGVDYIQFTDSLLNGHPGRLQQLAEGLAARRRKLKWSAFMRANMTPESAALLRRAGCDSVFVGVESLSDETLALMNKRRTEPQNIAALRAFLGAGIHVVAGLIPGFPGDTREAYSHTIEKLQTLQREYPGKLRVNVEPFIVSPGQPLFSKLAESGLHGLPWNDQVLDLAPRYQDITASILCTVDGSQQGTERAARLRIAECMETDEPVRADSFDYKGGEFLSRSEFEFDHLTTGWFMARLKGEAAWVYALIVNEEEQEKLQDHFAGEQWLDILACPASRKLLSALESRHLLPPRRSPILAYGGYKSRFVPTNRYQLSPFVVCRQLDWRVKNRVIVADFTTQSWLLFSTRVSHALPLLDRSPHTAGTLEAALSRSRHPLAHHEIVRLLEDLTDSGLAFLAESDFAKTSHKRRAMARAASASGGLLPVVEQLPAAEGCCH